MDATPRKRRATTEVLSLSGARIQHAPAAERRQRITERQSRRCANAPAIGLILRLAQNPSVQTSSTSPGSSAWRRLMAISGRSGFAAEAGFDEVAHRMILHLVRR